MGIQHNQAFSTKFKFFVAKGHEILLHLYLPLMQKHTYDGRRAPFEQVKIDRICIG